MNIHKSTLYARPLRGYPFFTAIALLLCIALVLPSCSKAAASGSTAKGGKNADGSVGASSESSLSAEEAALAENKAAEDSLKGDSLSSGQATEAASTALAALPVAAPRITLASGVYALAQKVSLSVDTKDALLMYTLDGTAPSSKKGVVYTAPITIATTAELRAIAYIPGGNTSAETKADYAINELFVAPGGSGVGNRKAAFADIPSALVKAKSLGIRVIKIASGTYEGSVEITSPVVLSGGWQNGFLGRSTVPSVIKGSSSSSSSKLSPSFALKLSGSGLNTETRIEQLEIIGGEASYSAAIVISDGATPLLTGVRSQGGFGSYGYGAVVLSNANPVFRLCTLSGGEGSSSFGLSVDSARAQVTGSILLAGKGAVGGYGLSSTNASVSVASSVLSGNAANVSYGAAFYNCKNSALENCTIVGGNGKEGVGVFISAGDPAVVNCIISAQGSVKSFGLVDNYGDSAPSSLTNNVFIGCAGGFYYDVDTKAAYGKLNAEGQLLGDSGFVLAKPVNTANSAASFILDAANAFKTPSGAVLPLAKILAGNAATDISGKARTAPWSVGAYEL